MPQILAAFYQCSGLVTTISAGRRWVRVPTSRLVPQAEGWPVSLVFEAQADVLLAPFENQVVFDELLVVELVPDDDMDDAVQDSQVCLRGKPYVLIDHL